MEKNIFFILMLFNVVKESNKIYKLPINSLLEANNKIIRISDSASPIFDKDGVFDGLVIVFHDVTEDYNIRKILIDSEKKYKRLYNNIPEIIYTLNLDGYFTSINDAVNQLGYEPSDIIGKHISDFVSGDDLKISNEHLNNKKNGFDLVSKSLFA